MAYLDNTSITVDAILTKKGRELLAKGQSAFRITQFALADDEIDYDLWNPAHPLGKNYYGVAIENMPITEAVPDETQVMKYKLVTFPKGQAYLPFLTAGSFEKTGVTLLPASNQDGTSEQKITVTTQFKQTGENNTTKSAGLNAMSGYTVTLLDSTYVTVKAGDTTIGNFNQGDMASSISGTFKPDATGDLILTVARSTAAKTITEDKVTKLVITGNDTGGRIVIPITIKKIS